MPRRWLAAIPLLVLAACSGEQPDAAPGAAATGSPPDSADFVVAGLAAGADSGAVRRLLGHPDSVASRENALNPQGELLTWYYRDLEVWFAGDPESFGFLLTGPGPVTRRGARVGDAPPRIRQLYGEPRDADEESWDYADPADESARRLVRFTLGGGRITKIFVGWVLD